MINRILVFLISLLVSSTTLQASGTFKMINWYEILFQQLGITDEHVIHGFAAIPGSVLALASLVLIGWFYRRHVLAIEQGIRPISDEKFRIYIIIEGILGFIEELAQDVIGKDGKKFFPLLGGIFLYILACNLWGLVPGFPPPTENFSNNLMMATIIFVFYNFIGFKEHGVGYLKHFLGPLLALAPLMLIIEIISHFARILSLSLRLTGNIFGDHLVLSVFTDLTWVVLPAFLLFFGLLVAIVQSFVFTLLTSIYIGLAMSHDH